MALLQGIGVVGRDRLHHEWMEHAEQAFSRMFAEDQQEGLVTFTQREERAVDLGRELARWLVEEHVAADPAGQPSLHGARPEAADGRPVAPVASEPCRCPKCDRPGVLVTGEEEALPGRKVTSLAGEVRLEREQYRCTACRVVFFPLGPEVGADGGGVQPAGAAEGGAPGE